MAPPGRSPSRLRSKTADLSDRLRGSPSKPSSESTTPPVPAIPSTSEPVTPKSKRTLTGFLGLKRKSGGLTLNLDPGAKELKDAVWSTEDPVPAIPDALLKSRILTSGSSLPSSLPPVNISPPSLGGRFTRSSTTTSKSRPSITNPPQSESDASAPASAKLVPLRVLRTQKSISFEVSRPFNVAHTATASAMPSLVDKSKKPVITVSAPGMEGAAFSAPRVAPTLPLTPSKSNGDPSRSSSRRPLAFSFSHLKRDDAKEKARIISHSTAKATVTSMQNKFATTAGEQPSPSPSLSPIMRFPVPPKQGESATDGQQTSGEEALTGAFSHSPCSTLSPTVSPHTATPSDLSDRSPTPRPAKATPSRPTRPTSLIIPSPSMGKRPSSSPSSKTPPSPSSSTSRQSIASIKARYRRSSRCASPASPPPKDPLPSPPTSATFPSSDTEGWTTDASTTIGGWTTDASSRIGSVGTIPSLASRRSVASAARLRANTIAVVNATKLVSGATSSGDEMDLRRSKGIRSDLSSCISGVLSNRHSDKENAKDDKTRDRMRAGTILASQSSSAQAQARPHTAQGGGCATPAHEENSTRSLRAAHETFVRMLREKHAAEKAELLRRLERLEKEARRREREIKGLRWLIMNANAENGGARVLSAEDQLVLGRVRSSSKTSDLSALSSGRSRSSSIRHSAVEELYHRSPERNSVEEGLKDLQETVSDIIAPNTYSNSPSNSEDARPDSPSDASSKKDPKQQPEGLATKHSRRLSSPVIPNESSKPVMSGGLGFDIPSIPGSNSDMSLLTAESMSLPSLTAANTASTLSVIPEVTPVAMANSECSTKEEKRSSKTIKRLSASASAQTAYASNLKIGMSPSIEQVLDRTRALENRGMDDVLKKLRAFGGSS